MNEWWTCCLDAVAGTSPVRSTNPAVCVQSLEIDGASNIAHGEDGVEVVRPLRFVNGPRSYITERIRLTKYVVAQDAYGGLHSGSPAPGRPTKYGLTLNV